jgi:hypothetical protein
VPWIISKAVAAFVGQACVPGDVEEADRRRPLRSGVQSRAGHGQLEALEDVPHPRIGLLAVVDREDRLIVDRRELGGEAAGDLPDIGGRRPGLEEPFHDLGSPPTCFGFGHAPEALTPDT